MNAPVRFAHHPLEGGLAPGWASEWGEDGRGLFAGFTVGGVTQILRWIRPGRFTMGSPVGEVGRFDNEGPAHDVTITEGFWMSETPCTQALWQAVMGENPSWFTSPAEASANRPVERVSWNDAQAFIARTNDAVRGLDLALPTEAQWEYACRAQTPLYASSLDAVAWHAGNSGSGTTAHQTRPGRGKAPNPWGLYDMIGNVWEWCADGPRAYTTSEMNDPLGPTDPGAPRVLRGGSWGVDARHCRSAARIWIDPDDRSDYIGFRPVARVQDPGRG
jgi:formylglycine-generating enzyme required for sulfatase activity